MRSHPSWWESSGKLIWRQWGHEQESMSHPWKGGAFWGPLNPQAGSELLSIKPWGLGRFLSLHACPPDLPNRLAGDCRGSSKVSAATLVCKVIYSHPSNPFPPPSLRAQTDFKPTMYSCIKLSLHSRPSNLYLPSAGITEWANTSGQFFVLPWGKWERILQWRKA